MEVHHRSTTVPSSVKSSRVIVPLRLLPQPNLKSEDAAAADDKRGCCSPSVFVPLNSISDAVAALLLLGQQPQPTMTPSRKRPSANTDSDMKPPAARRRRHRHQAALTPLEALATVATVELGSGAASAAVAAVESEQYFNSMSKQVREYIFHRLRSMDLGVHDLPRINLRGPVRQVDFSLGNWYADLIDYGHHLTDLTLIDCAITRLTLRHILQGTPNLVKLTLANLTDSTFGQPLPTQRFNWKLVHLTHLSVRITMGQQTTAHWPLHRDQTASLEDVNLEFEDLAGYLDELRSWFVWLEMAGHLVKRLRIVGCSLTYASWHRLLGSVPNLRELLITNTIRLDDGLAREVGFIDTITYDCATLREEQIIPREDWKLPKLETLRLFEFGKCYTSIATDTVVDDHVIPAAECVRDLLIRVPATLSTLAIIGGPDPNMEAALMAKKCAASLTELTLAKSYWDALNALYATMTPLASKPLFPRLDILAVVPRFYKTLLSNYDLWLIAKHCGTVSRLIVPTCSLELFKNRNKPLLPKLVYLTIYQPCGDSLVPSSYKLPYSFAASGIRATA